MVQNGPALARKSPPAPLYFFLAEPEEREVWGKTPAALKGLAGFADG